MDEAALNVELVLNNPTIKKHLIYTIGLTALAALVVGCGTDKPPLQKRAELPPAPEIASGYRSGMAPVYAQRHMAASANPLATEAGQEMLRKGGAAIDAAIAMQAVLSLVEPQASGIGGGAFIMYWDGKRAQAYDGRESAPGGAHNRIFLKPDGTPMAFTEAQIGGRSVGVPGVLRALEMAHQQHGKLPWRDLFQPAIKLAREGFPVSKRLSAQIAADKFIVESPDLAKYFLTAEGKPLPVGFRLKNPALAETLTAIANQGADAFYHGANARAIVEKVNGHKTAGTLSLNDLSTYQAKEREPVCGAYKAWNVCGMPPPSSGGVAVLQTLSILEALQRKSPALDLAKMLPQQTDAGAEPTAQAVHLVAEAERLAYADRALYLADPDYVPVNVWGLTNKGYLSDRSSLVSDTSMGVATAGVPPGMNTVLAPDRSPLRISTSQIAAVDDHGGAISMTTSVEAAFGSHIMVNGFVLNNQLTDFSFIPSENGKPVANRVEPGKRPRSSMAPTLVFESESGKLIATVGSPGGSQIIEYVNKALVGMLDWNLNPQDAINLPNFGSRNVGTEVESGMVSSTLVQQLKDRGHDVTPVEMTSGTQIIRRHGNGWVAGADPRREGTALGD
ncbi:MULTISPECIES: gamma-glutamyltransferase [unclassified Pseudomonas]|uniref:gamma-glutamyltransferase n=1 Tax=unclassified Pseudomonas TaxID=196821 RepID=UPI000D9A471E|nr:MULTISPECIES: gamma-glutamyltransferase [unclassified Pseudomonas]PYG78409.1 gamma-glutamyltranspeptidase/glutathione hydrolase [Pseudomonas sp. RV120224-01c]PYG82650.1 gamma-glutamyltranspeptidase/glutathione hydrolase [Pseudomonas sp. RV120224-01b]